MHEVIRFHILAHIFISLIAGILMLAIWGNIQKRFREVLAEDNSQIRIDKGLLFLSLAMFVWVCSGAWAYIGNVFHYGNMTTQRSGNIIFSLLNSYFVLLAISYCNEAPRFIYQHKQNIRKLVIGFSSIQLIFLLLPLIGLPSSIFGIFVPGLPDWFFSGLITYWLGISFYKAFVNRGLKVVAYIAIATILLMFISQLPVVFLYFEDGFFTNLLRIIAKSSLICIFLVMATSWVIQLAHTPKPNEMMIKFMDWSLVKITIPSKGLFNQTINFGSKTTQYKNLLKFAVRRKSGEGEGQNIVVSLGGEIPNQTYLSRIIENINDILQLKEDQKLERKDLFTFVGQGQYRLRILPENITIDETLFQEFQKNSEIPSSKGI